jgi:hypothetical protein
VARNPVRTVATYESRQRQTAAGATEEHPELDKEVLDDLKTLGYIGGEDDEKR